MDREEYIEYLKSEEWREKRKAFMEDRGNECEECGEKGTQVHHLSYENVGDEDDDDVMVLCNQCHKEIHNKDDDGYGEW